MKRQRVRFEYKKGQRMNAEDKKYLSLLVKDGLRKLKVHPNKGKVLTEGHILKIRQAVSGSKNHAWKGGISKESAKIRSSYEYKQWRSAVFKRDNFTCIICSKKEEVSGKLHVDHIKPFAFFPELRLKIDNGRTLCEPCHKTTDTYGYKAKALYG